MLTGKEQYRYSRHLFLDKVGEGDQAKLEAAKVLVVDEGAGMSDIAIYSNDQCGDYWYY